MTDRLKPLEVKTINIANKAVTSDKIADKAVDNRQIKEGAVTPDKLSITPASRPLTPPVDTAEIKDGAVTPAKLSVTPITRPLNPQVGTDEIRDGAVTKAKLADGTIGTAELIDGSVTTPKLAPSSVTQAKIAAGAVRGTELGDGVVSAAKLATDAVETAKIKDRAVNWAKIALACINHELLYNIAPPTDGQIPSFDSATGKFKWIDAPAPGVKIKTGQYTGTYWSDYSVTGIGFQPKVVLVFLRETMNKGPFIRTDQETGEFCGWFALTGSSWNYGQGNIKSLDADGFTVAASSPANGLQNYDYIALG